MNKDEVWTNFVPYSHQINFLPVIASGVVAIGGKPDSSVNHGLHRFGFKGQARTSPEKFSSALTHSSKLSSFANFSYLAMDL